VDALNQQHPSSSARAEPAPDVLSDRVRALQLPDFAESPGIGRFWLAGAGVLLLAALGGLLAYQFLHRHSADNAAAAETPPPPAAAAPASPAVAPGGLTLESKGYIIPARQILVSPKVSGMIERLSLVEGQRVKRGDVLAVLESTDYEAEVASATAALEAARHRLTELKHGSRPEEIAQARAELAATEAERVQLESEWKRAMELRRQEGMSAISATDFEVAESRYRAIVRRAERLELAVKLAVDGPRREKIDAAHAEVRQAEAQLTKARWRLDNCTIRAPISGTILKKNAEEGNVVNPIAFNGSFSLCEMADLSDLEVELMIQERDVSRVSKGQKCKIRAEAWPARHYQGEVSRLMPIADRAKGAVPVRVKVQVPPEEEGVYLKPEMGVIVSFYESDSNRSPAPAAAAAHVRR
jgi:multidrug resistance efflux pump